MLAQPGGQTAGAAEASHPHSAGRQSRVGDTARQRGGDGEAALVQRCCELARLGGPTQDQEHGATPSRGYSCPGALAGGRARAEEYRWLSRKPSAASAWPTRIVAVRRMPARRTCWAMVASVPRSTSSSGQLARATTAAGQAAP